MHKVSTAYSLAKCIALTRYSTAVAMQSYAVYLAVLCPCSTLHVSTGHVIARAYEDSGDAKYRALSAGLPR
eukprot:2713653-Rhodomonas_salina.1